MVPDRPANTASGAELLLFERIRDELPGEWIALHSVGLTIHSSKPWAELDFVLIGPPGVICLEVKGGTVSREEGIWYTTPRHGPNAGSARDSRNPRSSRWPPPQPSYSISSIRVCRKSRRQSRVTPSPYPMSPGRSKDLTLTFRWFMTNTTHPPIRRIHARVTKRWREKVGSNWNRTLEPLGRPDKQQILDSIRGDFQLVPSLRGSADLAERELIRLTEEQAALFGRLSSNPRILVSGGAGTGKTVIAVEEARRLAGDGERVLYTCFNKNLATHVSARLEPQAGVTVRTFHGLMMDLIRAAGRQSDLPDVSDEDLMSLFLPELALEVILEARDSPNSARSSSMKVRTCSETTIWT